MDISEFKPIAGFDGRYLIDRDGNILSMYRYSNRFMVKLEKPKLLHPVISNTGYKVVNLFKGHRGAVKYQVHRLVALTFLENPENKRCVCHKDNNKLNCNVDNLYWGTYSENSTQAYDDSLKKDAPPIAKLDLNNNVLEVYLNQSRAGKANDIPPSNISECLNQARRKTTKGFKWKRITRTEYEYYVNLKK